MIPLGAANGKAVNKRQELGGKRDDKQIATGLTPKLFASIGCELMTDAHPVSDEPKLNANHRLTLD